ncbi:hypothetical protein F1559_000446 [Cyanidiococcus yangmingshanensis]|uniref:Lipid-A-disaccharide synthase n=1 Tax=Cyanidiococcus yangmingshanensis TaxID=2690220 RepID=A0A7J7IKR8_9RHOD|nr:hypothetical protein F1559_000446 [Cyanidiococcus yangmingshanensis]
MVSSSLRPATEQGHLPDLLILSNGPGELYTWVRPLVSLLGHHFRISIALAPCPHASGHELEAATQFPNTARVLPPEHFWRLLVGSEGTWAWHPGRCGPQNQPIAQLGHWQRRGVVLFLGGDQFFAGCIAWRLGYPCVAYAEWEAMWPGWIPFYAVRRHAIRRRSRSHWLYRLCLLWVWILGVLGIARQQRLRFVPKIIVVGDLTTDSVWQYGDVRERARTLRNRYLNAYAQVEAQRSMLKVQQADMQSDSANGCSSPGAVPTSPRSSTTEATSTEAPGDRLVPTETRPNRTKHSLLEVTEAPLGRPLVIGLLPGSKPNKLALMVPFLLLCAYHMHLQAMQLGVGPLIFVLPVAPGLDTATLQRFADPAQNSMFDYIPGASARLPDSVATEERSTTRPGIDALGKHASGQVPAATPPNGNTATEPFESANDEHPAETYWLIEQVYVAETDRRDVNRLRAVDEQVPIFLHVASPAHAMLAATDLCLTTVGANTAELASLWTPAMVLVPTHRLDVMRAWDGLLGILCRLPILGTWITIATNKLILWLYATRRWGYLALPNRWAGNQELLPERVGCLDARQLAAEALSLTLDEEKCNAMRRLLQYYARPSGAVRRLAVLVQQALRSQAV